jgi:hypothetical protein
MDLEGSSRGKIETVTRILVRCKENHEKPQVVSVSAEIRTGHHLTISHKCQTLNRLVPSKFLIFSKHCEGAQIKEDQMDGACTGQIGNLCRSLVRKTERHKPLGTYGAVPVNTKGKAVPILN